MQVLFSLHPLPLLLSAALGIGIEVFWFSPFFLGKISGRRTGKPIWENALVSLTTAIVLAWLFQLLAVESLSLGVPVALVLCIAFSALPQWKNLMDEGGSWKLYWIQVGCELVRVGVMAGILSLWR